MAKPKKIDWVAAEHEYITTKMSYADIAKKYSVSCRLVNTYGAEHKWFAKRKEYLNNVSAKLAAESEDKAVKKLLRLSQVADKVVDVLEKTVSDAEQFNRYVVTEATGDFDQRTSEYIFKKTDTKALRDVVTALKDITTVIRNVNEIPTEAEKEQREAAKERLQMEKAKTDNTNKKDTHFEVSFGGGYIPEWGKK